MPKNITKNIVHTNFHIVVETKKKTTSPTHEKQVEFVEFEFKNK
jgi:hypothetical protein